MGENKQERFGTGSGVRANPDGGSAGVRAEAGPGDRAGVRARRRNGLGRRTGAVTRVGRIRW
ncbi:hypothetical protein [Amycolatopsis echigonensis]|uniref:Uncharacterized protein n=1 Tax=Amycolatopsis echigonensis TaxID=2576905 RepID=A0A8E1W437_9PSEU|nr:hypothetical protein [Amycolatopsis echigonensis]MBB2503572.1 hypothetical protein [Amycolatopsis echigonensis]